MGVFDATVAAAAANAAGGGRTSQRMVPPKPKQPAGAMLQRARSLAVGGRGQPSPQFPTKPLPVGVGPGQAPGIASMSGVQEGQAGPPGMFNHPGQQLGTPDAMDSGTAEGIRRMGGTPPIFAGGQQPGGPPVNSPLQAMDGGPGMFVPPGGGPGASGAPGPGDIPPGISGEMAANLGQIHGTPTPWTMGGSPDVRPTGQHPLNPAAGGGGMPPGMGMQGMQLPPELQQAVQAGRLDPQQAFDRAMQNRAGFRQRVMQAQQQGPPQMQRGIRNLSDVFRGGTTLGGGPGQMPLNTKPLPANGAGGVAQQGALAGTRGDGVPRGPFGY